MKSVFSALLFCFLALPAKADFDGCYQMFVPSVMYPAFCLDGTNEEGIGGSGARLVIFSTNTDLVLACGLSSSLDYSNKELKFIQNGKPELILKNIKMVQGLMEGDAILGKTQLKFLKLGYEQTTHLMSRFHQETRCRDLQIGQLKKLR